MGMTLQAFTVFSLFAQVDVNPLPPGSKPERMVIKNANAMGRAALKAVAAGDYNELKRMTAYSLARKEWSTLAKEFKERAEAKAETDLKNAKGEEAEEIKKKLQRMKDRFNDKMIDEAMERIQAMEKKFQDSFKKLRKEGETKGIDWERTLFKEVEASKDRRRGPANMEKGDHYVIFLAGKKVYHLNLDNCLESSRLGWLIGPESLQLREGTPANHRDEPPPAEIPPAEISPVEEDVPKKEAVPEKN